MIRHRLLWPMAGAVVTAAWVVASLSAHHLGIRAVVAIAGAAAAAVVTATAEPEPQRWRPAALHLAATPLIAAGMAWRFTSPSKAVAVLAVVAAFIAGVAAAWRWDAAALIVIALVLGVVAAPVVPLLALVVAATATLVAALAEEEAMALAAVAVAAAAHSSTHPAALLLAAGAALAVALPRGASVAAALPGTVVLAGTLAGRRLGAFDVVVAVLLAVAVVAAALRSRAGALPPATWPAVALAAWLVVAPGTWRWAGPARLAAYSRGAAIAVAAGGLAVVARRVAESAVPRLRPVGSSVGSAAGPPASGTAPPPES